MLMPDWSDNSLNYFAINKDRSASATAYANANATSTRMRAIQLAPTSRLYMQTGGGLKTNEWVHLCAVFVSQTQAFAYVDGQLGVVQAGGDTGTNLVNMAGALVEVVVGGSVANEGAASRMNGGRLDDLMVYSIALTSNQVFDLYNWAH
jgi:triosephosphate isomerase